MQKKITWKKYILIVILLLNFILTGCVFFSASESDKKLDSRGANRFPNEAYDMLHVLMQKNKNIPSSYKLKGGFKEFKKLDIVKDAKIKGNKINVNFFIKDMYNEEKKDKSMEKIIWENSLFLSYTIVDTFPAIEKIRLSADYYFLDEYGNPYKETLFIANTKRNQLKLINRDYFKPNMLAGIIDYYMVESIKKDNKEK